MIVQDKQLRKYLYFGGKVNVICNRFITGRSLGSESQESLTPRVKFPRVKFEFSRVKLGFSRVNRIQQYHCMVKWLCAKCMKSKQPMTNLQVD